MCKIHASAKNLNLWYDNKQILFDVNLDVYKKEVTALIGPSGCGKSTFLRCFNRMNDFIQGCKIGGSISVDGMDVYSCDTNVVLLRAKVGMVFQKPNPFPKSIYDNIAYGPKLHRLVKNKKKLDEVVEKSLRSVGLWEELYDRLKDNACKLSGGQQQRLCIARAIAVKPTMLLMDEPCSALDPVTTGVIESLIKELKKSFTIIIVTHSMKQARKISDKVVFFYNGKIIEHNDTEEMFNNPKSLEAKKYILDNL
ncbi:phosphate ABC transporter ATP-binding protein PstB [Candidatus Neoehrlichia procyonis]|uniref:Phosphate ABC transporter, ATP-binding protein n=1 Tax=Candidatus Neoehrlichia procyonis str. RAC413 TaxID=1359163 RepID=A0A0F3NQ38_9RICK|nr:phosphate ABC transporter ATP-binding protein PstB [Candidatus Neoehrlichia lotoris]KJV69029.1 phosphate ABC transporter, ATP-binding protein [Candidatus Neoehrlichia lotoris str. RAC413]